MEPRKILFNSTQPVHIVKENEGYRFYNNTNEQWSDLTSLNGLPQVSNLFSSGVVVYLESENHIWIFHSRENFQLNKKNFPEFFNSLTRDSRVDYMLIGKLNQFDRALFERTLKETGVTFFCVNTKAIFNNHLFEPVFYLGKRAITVAKNSIHWDTIRDEGKNYYSMPQAFQVIPQPMRRPTVDTFSLFSQTPEEHLLGIKIKTQDDNTKPISATTPRINRQ